MINDESKTFLVSNEPTLFENSHSVCNGCNDMILNSAKYWH